MTSKPIVATTSTQEKPQTMLQRADPASIRAAESVEPGIHTFVVVIEALWVPAIIVMPDLTVGYANRLARSWLAGAGVALDARVLPFGKLLPSMPPQVAGQIRSVLASGGAHVEEYSILLGQTWSRIAIETTPLVAGGEITAALVVLRDVTARHERETLWREKEEGLERSSGATGLFDPEGYLVYANPAFRKIWKLASRDVTEGLHFAALWSTQVAYDDITSAVREQGAWSGELLACSEDEPMFPVHLAVSVVRGDTGDVEALVANVIDIGDELRHEERVAESEATLRALLDVHHDPTFLLNPDGAVIISNRSADAVLELPPGTISGQLLDAALPTEAAELLRLHLVKAVRDRAAVSWESPVAGRILRSHLCPVNDGDGGVARLILSCTDITETQQVTEALRRSDSTLDTVLVSAPVAIATFDHLGRLTTWNPAAERTFGWSSPDALGRKLTELYQSDENDRTHCIESVLAGETITDLGATCHRTDGIDVDVLVSAAPLLDAGNAVLGGVLVAADITARNRLQAHLVQAQKLEAAANLAAGVAHDMANLLQALTSFVEKLKLRAADPARVLGVAESLAIQVRRGAALAEKLTLFSGRADCHRETHDLRQLLLDSVGVLRSLLPESIVIETDTGIELLPAEVDPARLRQVLVHLAQNSAEAMPKGGVVTLRCGWRSDRVFIEVRDSGIGLAPDLVARAFDPFFTTKDPFLHPGLGLAVVQGVVTELGGTLALDSTPGRGTVARIELPRSKELLPAAPQAGPSSEDIRPGRGERVLIVEDEDGAREGLWDMLTMLGYHVVAVGSGQEALMLPASWHFDALLADCVLPDSNGPDLARTLLGRWPTMQTVLMSGYQEDDLREAAAPATHFLQKPFGIEVLAHELRTVIESAAHRVS
jgi:two-component system, cell cycle sensor histidine kinase and response regulator CckA